MSGDTAQQTDGETPKELELLIEDIEDIAAPEVDTATAESPEDSEAVPQERLEAKSPAATEEADALDKGDQWDPSEETDTARISGRALDDVQSVSLQDAAEEQFTKAPDKPQPIGQTYRSSRPPVDFRVESLFDEEFPQSDSRPSGTAHDSYPLSEEPVEISSDMRVPPVADPEGTAPIRMHRRYDHRLVIGVASGLVLSTILLFAISDWEWDSDKTVGVKPNPTASSPAPKSDEERDNAVSATHSQKAPSASAAKEEPSKSIQPTEIAKQDVAEKAQPADDLEPKRSSPSKSRKSSARASSSNTSSDRSASATKLRTEAREHYAAGRYKSASTAYRKITKLEPSDAGAFAGLGASYLALNRAKRAIAAYKRAIKLQPKNSGFHAALARAYATKGDRDRAIKTYQQALRLNPRNRIAKAALQQLTQK